MSREIKFRFWDTKEGKWLGKDSSYWKELTFKDCRNKLIASMRQGNIIAEQYTGLTDKNGKETYEGDIVRYADDYEENAEVVFDDGGFQVEWPINIERLEGDITCMMEVIGNIHENPELLGGEE